jgi:hypothetical protein
MHDLTTIPFGLWPATLKRVKEAPPRMAMTGGVDE